MQSSLINFCRARLLSTVFAALTFPVFVYQFPPLDSQNTLTRKSLTTNFEYGPSISLPILNYTYT